MSVCPKISLAMIARNRGRQLHAALSSIAAFVDEIVVVLAGPSDDDTAEVARSFGARVIPFFPENHPEAFYVDEEACFSKWGIPGPYSGQQGLADFSAPRNLSFKECKGDYIFWIDSDDTVRHPEKLAGIVQQMEAENIESVFMQYEYEHDEQGNCTVRQVRERIIRRADFSMGKIVWHQPIHEHLRGMKKGGLFEDVVIVHHTETVDKSVNKSSNLSIEVLHRDQIKYRNLKCLAVESDRLEKLNQPLDWRLSFYLGVEMRTIDPDRAVKYLYDYLTKSGWDEERAQARYFIGQVREMQINNEEAWSHFAGATLEFPSNPSSWFGLARIAFIRGNWKAVIEYTEKGFAQVCEDIVRKPALTLNPLEWRYRAHLPYSRALIEMERYDDAEESCAKGLSVNPNCPYLLEHQRMLNEILEPMKGNVSVGRR